MNRYFSSIRYNLASKMPNPPKQFTEYLPKLNFDSSFFFNPVSPSDIELEIMTIPLNKVYGLYSFATRILKSVKHIISQPLSLLINKPLGKDVYLFKLKLVKVIPIYQSDDESAPSNHRPISLLSVFNRIFEKKKKRDCIIVLNRFLSNIISFMIHNMVFVKKDLLNMLFWTQLIKLKLTWVQNCTHARFL